MGRKSLSRQTEMDVAAERKSIGHVLAYRHWHVDVAFDAIKSAEIMLDLKIRRSCSITRLEQDYNVLIL